MAEQSNLERIGIEERLSEFAKSPYNYSEETPYSKNHPDAISDGDEKGKGTGVDMGVLDIPAEKGTHATATKMGITMNTEAGGGKYDVEGTKGVQGAFQGNAGRNWLIGSSDLNRYKPGKEYGQDSVDINREIKGQYWVE